MHIHRHVSRIGSLSSRISSRLISAVRNGWNSFVSSTSSGLAKAGGFVGSNAVSNTLKLWEGATGSRFTPGGWGLVGEHGPELVQLPRGSKIYPAISTERMLSNTTNNAGDTFNTTINGVSAEDVLARFEERVLNRNRRFI